MRYPALCTEQVPGSHKVVLFSAPAVDIESWSGIPQKKGGEDDNTTTGFQRDENQKRISALVSFMKNKENVIQNPLLCATQTDVCGKVVFIPNPDSHEDRTQAGFVEIEFVNFGELTLLQLLRGVRDLLEKRVPDLNNHQIDQSQLAKLKQQIQLSPSEEDVDSPEAIEEEEPSEIEPSSSDDAAAIVFSDESHVLDFWHDLAVRIRLLEELGDEFNETQFLGFSREAMISFLKPVVVMDGQHRLRGAIESAKSLANESGEYQSEIERRINDGEEACTVQRSIERKASRLLPVSLLLSDDPAEHVFQFVVVNQKATPIGKALLGTIVSTTLSNEELNRVSQRLASAEIQLDQSRSVAYITRNPLSPFRDKIETGIAGEASDRLAWSVASNLIKLFQYLNGGKLFGQKIDFADKWKRDHLDDSSLVSDYSEKGFDCEFDYWSSQEGPWRVVFLAFFDFVKNEFGTTDEESFAYWGSPKSSNLFNKISLTILASDFFQFMVEREFSLASVEDMKQKLEQWVTDVSRDYFNRDWKLSGAKKDGTGIRGQWAKLWVDYRKDPVRMPKSSEYRKNL